MTKPDYCPDCGIGLNTKEIELGHCQNCKGSWNTDYEPEHFCPECFEDKPDEELEMFGGYCEDCSLDFN